MSNFRFVWRLPTKIMNFNRAIWIDVIYCYSADVYKINDVSLIWMYDTEEKQTAFLHQMFQFGFDSCDFLHLIYILNSGCQAYRARLICWCAITCQYSIRFDLLLKSLHITFLYIFQKLSKKYRNILWNSFKKIPQNDRISISL